MSVSFRSCRSLWEFASRIWFRLCWKQFWGKTRKEQNFCLIALSRAIIDSWLICVGKLSDFFKMFRFSMIFAVFLELGNCLGVSRSSSQASFSLFAGFVTAVNRYRLAFFGFKAVLDCDYQPKLRKLCNYTKMCSIMAIIHK